VVPDADGRFVVKFEKIDCIEPGGEAAAGVGHYGEEEGKRDVRISDFIPSLDPRLATKTYDIPISYEDINGQRRQSVVRMGKGGIRLLRHGKVAGTEGNTDALTGRLDRLERWARRLK